MDTRPPTRRGNPKTFLGRRPREKGKKVLPSFFSFSLAGERREKDRAPGTHTLLIPRDFFMNCVPTEKNNKERERERRELTKP